MFLVIVSCYIFELRVALVISADFSRLYFLLLVKNFLMQNSFMVFKCDDAISITLTFDFFCIP
jgi:hypothetical protein